MRAGMDNGIVWAKVMIGSVTYIAHLTKYFFILRLKEIFAGSWDIENTVILETACQLFVL
jgi:hypothetical protein